MIKIILLSSSWIFFTSGQEVKKQGMRVRWSVENEMLQVEAAAPATGWVAVGFNDKDQLSGTNLVMGAFTPTKVMIKDQYIVRAGKHLPVTELGGKDRLVNTSVVEEKGETILTFSLPLDPEDPFHCAMRKGNTYYLLMAYSVSDDPDHHSRMRTSVRIQL